MNNISWWDWMVAWFMWNVGAPVLLGVTVMGIFAVIAGVIWLWGVSFGGKS